MGRIWKKKRLAVLIVQVGRLGLCLFSRNSNYLGWSVGVVRGVVCGVLREARVDKSFLPLSTLVVALHFSMEKQPKPWTALPFEIPLSALSNWVMCLKIPENTLTSLYFCCKGQSTSWSFGDMTVIKSWERRFAHDSTLWSFYRGNLTLYKSLELKFSCVFPHRRGIVSFFK